MDIAVMGAGAVGCYYGGMLARAGHALTLIGRPVHVEAVRRDGLLLDARGVREHVKMAASTEPEAVRGAQLVLFCVKSTDTESAGAAMAAALDPGATVMGLQNGVDNAERLRVTLGRPVAPAVVYVATSMGGPGHVQHHGRGELVVGAEAAAWQAPFAAAGIPVEVSPNVVGALWEKLVVNCAYNAMSAITQLPYGELVKQAGVDQTMREVVLECLAVAQAAGVRIPGDSLENVRRIAQTMPGQYSSTAQDLARGRPSEIDHLNGLVLRKGEAMGVPTPANRMLHTLVKLLEGRALPFAAKS